MFFTDLWRYSLVLSGAGLCLALEAEFVAQHHDALLAMIAACVQVLT